jgi:2,4-dienoyl-CoA reductase-like NADH-dependent reductase (Old Yellow Enzyme family)
MTHLPHLFSPITIRNCDIRNRILVSGHMTSFTTDGLPNDRYVRYHEARAKGGAGLIVMEATMVAPEVQVEPHILQGWRDDIIPWFKRISDAVHAQGAKIICQAWHNGNQSQSYYSWQPIKGVSPIPSAALGEVPEALDKDQIRNVIQQYVDFSLRLKEGGFDGVELHFGHGYLPQQFLSPYANIRTDEYGGSLENRMRFGLELMQAVRKAVGDDFVVGIRTSGDEMTPGGYTLDDMKEIAPVWDRSGFIDYLNVTVGTYVSAGVALPPMGFPPRPFVYLAAELRQVVDLPVFAAIRIIDPELAEEIVANGEADMVVMTRATICDPEMPNKAREGRFDDIRRCIDCNEGCWDRTLHSEPITCIQNPETGREGVFAIRPSASAKKILVIGGGCAGMKAAAVAKERGHRVSLYEKTGDLGGAVLIHAKAPTREEMSQVVRFLTHELNRLNVDVHMNTEATADMVLAESPDAVIVATGAKTISDFGPGSVGPFFAIAVEAGAHVVTAEDVLEKTADTGDRVVIADFQQYIKGILAADVLAEQGKQVTLIMPTGTLNNPSPYLVEGANLGFHMRLLSMKQVVFLPGMMVKGAKPGKVVLRQLLTEQDIEIEADTLVTAFWRKADTTLYDELKGKVPHLVKIGDCLSPHRLMSAIYQGYAAAMEL